MKKEYLVSAQEMQQYDRNTIEKIQIPSCVLMERAAYAVAMEAREFLKEKENPRVLVVAGNGNNGADGVCAGRILKEYGIEAQICLLKTEPPYKEELQRQLDIAEYYHIKKVTPKEICFSGYDLILDAIFGVGLNREITGPTREMIERIENAGVPVLSVDIPSGIDSTTGKVLGCKVTADITVTFGFYKRGQWLYPGRVHCGKVVKAKIGINETGFFENKPDMFTYMQGDGEISFQTTRDPMGNKGTFGKVFVIAGRKATTGAAVLCASSALRSGCGMTAVFTEKENKDAFLCSMPEIMVETYTPGEEEHAISEKLQKWLDWSDCVVIGCGLMRDTLAYNMVKYVLEHAINSVVCDADALQLIAESSELQKAVNDYSRRMEETKNSIVFTPHPGELAALAGCSIADIKADRMQIIDKVLEKYPVILAAKDADTLVCAKGQESYLNITGNDGLATAGSGDVLAGLTASMIAQSMRQEHGAFEAVCRSVYLHGLAADILAKQNGKSFLVASDLIEAYKYILK